MGLANKYKRSGVDKDSSSSAYMIAIPHHYLWYILHIPVIIVNKSRFSQRDQSPIHFTYKVIGDILDGEIGFDLNHNFEVLLMLFSILFLRA